jgi:hypothetical protein
MVSRYKGRYFIIVFIFEVLFHVLAKRCYPFQWKPILQQ